MAILESGTYYVNIFEAATRAEGSPTIVIGEVLPADPTDPEELGLAGLSNLDAGRQDAVEMTSGPGVFWNPEVAS